MDINIFNLDIAFASPVLISPYYPLISLLPSDTSLQILKTYLNLEKIGFKKNRYQLYNPFVSSICAVEGSFAGGMDFINRSCANE